MTDEAEGWNEALRAAARVSDVGLWRFEPASGRVRLDRAAATLFGCDREVAFEQLVSWLVRRSDADELRSALAGSADRVLTEPYDLRRGRDGAVLSVCFMAERRGSDWHGGVRDVSAEVAMARGLRQAKRLESMGRLSTGISHNFNNMLMVIGACLTDLDDTLQEGEVVDGEVRATIADAMGAVERAREVVQEMARMVRQEQAGPAVTLSVGELCDAAVSRLRRVAAEGVRLSIDVQPDLWVRHTRGALDQVLDNLLNNALDAVRGEASPEIELSVRAVQPFGADAVEVRVRDNGPGVPAHLVDTLFEPFVSSKGARGTGLGLATAAELVRRADGQIIHRRPLSGRGAEFLLLLPAVASERREAPPERPVESKKTGRLGGIRVLVVDDEPALAGMVKRMLAREGAEVLTASDSSEALQALQEPVDVVLLDRGLGRERGADLVPRLRAEAGRAALLYFTGGLVPEEERAEVDGVVPKPVRRGELVAVLREAAGVAPSAGER